MMDQKLAGKLNLSNIDILDYRIAANLLESAGDYIVDLATSFYDLSTTKSVNKIAEAGDLVAKMHEKSVAAFVNKNRSESTVVVKTYERFREIINSIKDESTNTESAITVLGLTYAMDKIARCWVDVADLVKPLHLTAPLKNA
jgi:phosphate uptake regulator